ncbi:GATOR complex protein WDR24-like isoform X2 [Nylanderia fulva]|uniref:GATOR complex protein WDR24-like isoform X2 n=1 Tax=Nylanderia fulva TaxID=613905 RepID=UPI0010FAD6A2|nr:GATOR complex protein WDR24-like isoform X2 [Nylanderia fulva]
MSETKLYAIVQFLADESFSEIPTNWIQRNNDGFICWWPNTKNISSLIKNRDEPDKKLWSRFDITVIKYCSSLASARKSAADAQYGTTDEEKCGRGQRKLKKNEYYFSENDENDYTDDSNDEERNACDDDEENYDNEKNKSVKHLKQNINRPVFNSIPEYNSQQKDNCCQSINTSSTDKNSNCFVSKNTDNEISVSRTNNNKCSSNEKTKKITYSDKSASPSGIMDIESIPILELPEIQDIYKILERIETGLDKVIRANVATNFELKSISRRLSTLESGQRNDAELTENDMKKLILKVGGTTPRNSVHRTLERIISNKCAINCSWKGVRLNYKISNLTFIKNIRDIICSVHSGLTESEFDITAAEWFRFAKHRAIREEKKSIIHSAIYI